MVIIALFLVCLCLLDVVGKDVAHSEGGDYDVFLFSDEVYQSDLTADVLYKSYVYKQVVSFPSALTDSERNRLYELLLSDYADITVSVGHSVTQSLGGQNEQFEQSLSAYMQYNNYSAQTPYYVFDSKLLNKMPKIKKMVDAHPVMDAGKRESADSVGANVHASTAPDRIVTAGASVVSSNGMTSVFTDFDAPIIFSIGKNSSGLSFHMHRHSYNELFFGEKLWFVYAPEKVPPIGFNPWELQLHWLDEVYPYLQEEAKPLMFVQRPGDIVYIPEGWYHATVSIGTTVSMTRQPLLARANSSYSYLLEADQHNKQKRLVDCYTATLRALEVARGYGQIDFNLMRRVGAASEKLYHNKTEAITYYKKAIRMNNLHPAAYVELAGLYYESKQYKKGLYVVAVAEGRLPPVSHPSLSHYKVMLTTALEEKNKSKKTASTRTGAGVHGVTADAAEL